jgi:hypothetical protein
MPPVVSPDKTLLAHFNYRGLYVRNLKTGEDDLIVDDADGWGLGMYGPRDVQVSPDGKRILFSICPPNGARCAGARVYTIKPDGSDLLRLADSGFDIVAHAELNIRSASYSPDGKEVLFQIESYREETHESEDNREGFITEPIVEYFVGLLPADAIKQHPEILAEGEPQFWSSDGTSVYFSHKGLCRMNLKTHKVTAVHLDTPREQDVLGAVPGEDAVFFKRHHSDCHRVFDTVDVLRLDGKPVDPALATLAASIPAEDSAGRRLGPIRVAGPRHLVLMYFKENSSDEPEEIPSRHVQLVTWDSLKQ